MICGHQSNIVIAIMPVLYIYTEIIISLNADTNLGNKIH